ncbi:hypothetical protein SLS60_006413 [Paraconiothyrium brasiliense]|uniref:Uncharacterized protein n=1 Tax=Paraconiothyrium brasiliense TaxID=300254 RepID=A0ABR3RB96_9PLEO
MSQPTLPDRIWSIFSIIKLEFKAPFTERGPPEFLYDLFTDCLNQLEKEESPGWIMWGDETMDPDRVCIMIGWKLPSGRRDSVSKAATSELKAKGVPRAIEPLIPFLTSSPSIRHVQSPDRNEPVFCGSYPWYERHCDFFTVDASSNGPLNESIKTEITMVRQNCISLLPDILCGKDHPYGDVKEVILGMNVYSEKVNPGLGSHVNDFVLLVYWSNPEAMTRFKHPELESVAQYGRKVETHWWRQEVLEHFARLKSAGARVEHCTFALRDFEPNYPLIWPDAEIEAARRRTQKSKEKGCKSCCTM